MKNKIKKNLFKIFLMTLAIVCCFQMPANASEVFTAETAGHYESPIDGSIEDPGNNPGIGDGMVQNVVNGLSLIEKDDSGRLYATVRYRLRSNIKDVKIWVYNKSSKSYIPVPVQETQTGADTGDFRFPIPSTDTVIRSSFFVIPMGRAVIFYVTLGQLHTGHGDFKVMVAQNTNTTSSVQDKPQSEQPTNQQNDTQTTDSNTVVNKTTTNQTPARTVTSTKAPSTLTSSAPMPQAPVQTSSGQGGAIKAGGKKRPSEVDLGYKHGLLTNIDFDDLSVKNSDGKNAPLGPVTRIILTLMLIVVSIVFSLFIIGAILIPILYKIKKEKNLALEEYLEDEEVYENQLGSNQLYDNYGNYVDNSTIEKECKNINRKNTEKTSDSLWTSHPGFCEEEENETPIKKKH